MKAEIIGNSQRTKELRKLIKSIAPTDGSVLITGESGCGKELYARAIHELSDRAAKPFIAINCGAIPAELLESAGWLLVCPLLYVVPHIRVGNVYVA